jgi:hypothetical protein
MSTIESQPPETARTTGVSARRLAATKAPAA